MAGNEELRLLLDMAWRFCCMEFTLYGYTFSYGQVAVAGCVISWGIWAYLRWLDV